MNESALIRHSCSRLGLGMLGYVAGILIFGSVGQFILLFFSPGAGVAAVPTLVLNALCSYALAPLVLWLIIFPMPKGRLRQRGITRQRWGKLVLESIGLMYAFALLTNLFLAFVNQILGLDTENLINRAVENAPLWAMVLFFAIIPPVCEELIFRKLLLERMLPLGERPAVILSALCFGLFHCNLYQFFYAVALGFLFGCIVVQTGRIRYTICLHALLNLLGTVLPMALTDFPAVSTLYTVAIYAAMAVGLFYFVQDMRGSLYPRRLTVPGLWQAAFTAPGFLVFVILVGLLSVGIIFLI